METFAENLRSAYSEVPERLAITLQQAGEPDLQLSYEDLIQEAAGYAHALDEMGVRPGEVVILIFNHGLDLVFSFIGAALHGAVPSIMPFLTEKLSPERYRDSLSALFEISEPSAVVTYPAFDAEVHKAIAKADLSEFALPKVLKSDQVSLNNEIDWCSLAGLQRSVNDLVLLQHSSGTTGLQKGVALSHRALFNQIENYSQALQMDADDVVVSWLPLYHDMGLIAGFIMPLLTRMPLVLLSPFDWVRAPYRLMQAISKYKGTLCWLPNFAYNFCAQKIRERDLQGVSLSSWRAVINCSEPMHWKSHELFLEKFSPFGLNPQALATCYAMAENVFAVTQGGMGEPVVEDIIDRHVYLNHQEAVPVNPYSEEMETLKMLSAGRPIANSRLNVLDDGGEELPDRHIGEIALQSDCMLMGYYKRPDLTEIAFLDGWYLTGDMGYIADGELYITGRKKDLIIVGGKNIYPQDIERLAGDVDRVHPGRVAAFGVFNDRTGTEDIVVVAEVEDLAVQEPAFTSNEPERTLEEIETEIRRLVTQGSDIALRHVYLVGRNWLVKTSSGKVARSANRGKYLEEVGY
ncbi:MAG: AMP-binding protein [Chloroflexota bacterium]|nr:AMP-binding protein [Chloroflexota bacterium]